MLCGSVKSNIAFRLPRQLVGFLVQEEQTAIDRIVCDRRRHRRVQNATSAVPRDDSHVVVTTTNRDSSISSNGLMTRGGGPTPRVVISEASMAAPAAPRRHRHHRPVEDIITDDDDEWISELERSLAPEQGSMSTRRHITRGRHARDVDRQFVIDRKSDNEDD